MGRLIVHLEEIFLYIYLILNSIKYRKKYEEFLKIDFPRIPIVNNYEVFLQISGFGKELAGLHLLKHESLNLPSAKYFGNGTNHVDKIEYVTGNVQINDLTILDPSEEVFQFQTIWELSSLPQMAKRPQRERVNT